MAKKIGKAIKDDLLRFLAFIEGSVNETVANDIAQAITNEMLNLISKGISPIEGQGRFPAYKWAAFRNELKKEKSAIASALRKNKKGLVVFRRKNKRQILLAQKEATRKGIAGVTGRYPFTAEAIKLGKKPRPVNLFLTGDFLFNLEGRVTGAAGRCGIEIGFFDEKSAQKESGHREGVNGQPSRPTIPVGTEEFAQTILNIIYRKMEEIVDRATVLGASSI